MNGHDEEFLDLVALLALGSLPEAQARDVAEHIRTCAQGCPELYADLRPVADFVGYASESTTLDEVTSARMKARVMSVVHAEAANERPAGAAPRRARPYIGWLGAAAAILLAVAIGADDLAVRGRAADHLAAERSQVAAERSQVAAQRAQLQAQQAQIAAAASKVATEKSQIAAAHSQVATERSQVAAERSRVATERSQIAAERAHVERVAQAKLDADARLATLLAPGSRHYDIPQGEVVTSGGRIYIALRLPQAPNGKVYQAWTVAKGVKGIAPSITFKPASNGEAIVELPIKASGIAAVAVSVEPAGGSKSPTSVPKFIRKLS